MRAVVDTNVLVSAVLNRGNPYRIYLAWLRRRFELVMSPPLLDELESVLGRRRVRRRIQWSSDRFNRFFRVLRRRAVWVEPQNVIDLLTSDPDDNRVLEAAVEGGADYIVTGDRGLLELRVHKETRIVTPRDFLGILTIEAYP
jgi:putative PIN family toxin of toxin-antitoxin system